MVVSVCGFSSRSLSWGGGGGGGGQICGDLAITVCIFPEEGGKGKDKLDLYLHGCW